MSPRLAPTRLRRTLVTLAVLVAASGGLACNDSSLRSIDRLLSGPSRIDFGAAYVGDQLDEAATFSAIADGKVNLNLLASPAEVRAPERLAAVPGVPAGALFRWQPVAAGPLVGEVVYGVDTDDASEWRIEVAGVAEPWPSCEDGDGCTADTFDRPSETCVHTPLDDVPCDDGSACTDDDVCVAGVCLGAALACADGLGCSTDACDPLIGCIFVPDHSRCADGDPCTQDVCDLGSGCENPEADSWSPCGAFDCALGHFCFFGECIELDISTLSDGMPCDDGLSCTDEGACAAGVCAPGPPRPPEVVAHLATFGTQGALAFDGTRYVYADGNDVDIVEAVDGVLRSVATLPLRVTALPLVVAPGRFLVLTVETTLVLIDSDNVRVLWESPLEILPPTLPDGAVLASQAPSGSWSWVSGGVAVTFYNWYRQDAETWTRYEPSALFYPLGPGLTPPTGVVDLEIPAMRVRADGSLLAWTGRYGGGVGVIEIDGSGTAIGRASVTHEQVTAFDCGQPTSMFWYDGGFATLSEELDVLGWQRPICFWNAVAGDVASFGLHRARRWYDHVHGVGFARLGADVFLSSTGDGYSGAQSLRVRRVPLTTLRDGTGGFSGMSLPMAYSVPPAAMDTAAGQLLFMGELSFPLVDGAAGLEPIVGPGLGRLSGLRRVEGAEGLVLGGGTAAGALVDFANPLEPSYVNHLAWLPAGYALYSAPSIVHAGTVGLTNVGLANIGSACTPSQTFDIDAAASTAESRQLCHLTTSLPYTTPIAAVGGWLVLGTSPLDLRRLADWSEAQTLEVPMAPTAVLPSADGDHALLLVAGLGSRDFTVQRFSGGDVPALQGEPFVIGQVPVGAFCAPYAYTCVHGQRRLAVDGDWLIVASHDDADVAVQDDRSASLWLYPSTDAPAPVASLGLGPVYEGYDAVSLLTVQDGRAFVHLRGDVATMGDVLVQVSIDPSGPSLREVGRVAVVGPSTELLDWDGYLLRAGHGGVDVLTPSCEDF